MDNLVRRLQVWLIAGLCCIASGVSAANNGSMGDAFSNSYAYENKGDYTNAVESLKKVYVESSYELNMRMGWLHYLAGLHAEAQTYYRKAIGIHPMSVEAHFGAVYPAAALGNWEQVIEQYVEILKIDPSQTLANYRLSAIYYSRREYAKALKHAERVVNLYPMDYDSVVLLAWINLRLDKLSEAKVLFGKALLLHPGDKSATEGLGLTR